MSNIYDLSAWWRKKPKPEPTPETPDVVPPKNNGIPLLRIGLILKSIPFKELAPVFFTVPVILFFTISGFLAWLMLALLFIVNIFTLGK